MMYILWKLLLTVIIIGLLNQTAFAKVLEGDDLRANIIKRLPSLNHTKLQALMQRVGKEAPEGYFQCLCNSYSVMGTGIGYNPNVTEGDCKDTPYPCVGGNWGCTSYPLPSKIIDRCVKNAKYDDNSTIVDAIVTAIEGLPNEGLPEVPEINLQSLLKDLFEKSCLPIPENINNLNPHKMILPEDILNKNHLSNMTQVDALSKIYSNIMKADNICEASIESKLSIDATQGKGMLGTAGSFVWIVKGKDEFDLFKGYASIVSGKVTDHKNLSKISKNATNLIKVFDYYNKFKSIASTYNDNIDSYQKNTDIKDALSVYKRSKSWNLKKINNSINKFGYTSQIHFYNRIKKLEQKRDEDLDRESPTGAENIICNAAVKLFASDIQKIRCSEIQQKYKKNKFEINYNANKKIRVLLIKSNSNLVKSQILERYRKPLIEKSCNEYIDDRLKNCSANSRRDKPLNHKDINKLWSETKEKIKKWNKTQAKIQEWKDNETKKNIIKPKE